MSKRKPDYNARAAHILEKIMHRKNWGYEVRDNLAEYLERTAKDDGL